MVDRADPVSRPVATSADPSRFPSRLDLAIAAIALLELAWLGWFLVAPLPNVPNPAIRRWLLILKAFPEVVPDTPYRESLLGKAVDELSHVENLPQRLPIVLAAGLIAAAAIGLGDAILGRLRMRDRLGRSEWIALSYGLGAAVLGGITLIVGRMGWLHPWFIRAGLAGLAIGPVVRMASRRARPRDEKPPGSPGGHRLAWFFGVLIAPFVAITMLGSMLPATDFDVLEYHLEGPKEYYQDGRIHFLPHNVYTNMPFNVEMLHLLGMSVMGDWWWGALAGQLLVALFGPATAVLIHATVARASPLAGWPAALIYLSTPWVYRIGVIAYVEGPLCFYHMALVWAWLAASESVLGMGGRGSGRAAPPGEAGESGGRASRRAAPPADRLGRSLALPVAAPPDEAGTAGASPSQESRRDTPSTVRHWLLLGLLAGGAMGCKYTGLVSAVIPFGLLAMADTWRRRRLAPVLGFALGWAIVMAPWLIKNTIDTGDPVYPLGYRFFHGRNWDDAREQQWRAVHGPRPFSWRELAGSIVDIAGRSDWQSPLYAALAPLALLRPGSRRMAGALWAYAAYLFATWFLLTHRLDRFWLPLLPILAALAGLGADWIRRRSWSFTLGGVLTIGLLSNLVYDSSALAGFNEWTGDLAFLRRDLPERLNPPLAALDRQLPPDARALLVGQAAVFHVAHPVVYNTVFNPEIIEEMARGKDVDALRRALHDRHLTHIYVDWKEIQRHRQPGGYGFTDFVTRERFARWVAEGLLDRPAAFGAEQELYRIR